MKKIIWQVVDSRSFGGIETHIKHLAHALSETQYRVVVVLLHNYGTHPVFDDNDFKGMEVIKLDRLGEIIGLMKRQQPEVIHSHGYKANLVCKFLCLFSKTKCVSTYHAGEPGDLKVALYCALDRWTNYLSRPIAVSANIAKMLRHSVPIINNFVPLPKQRTTKSSNTSINVAFVGRLSDEKDPQMFCDIAKSFGHISFSLYGDGPLYEQLKDNASDNVLLKGQISNMTKQWSSISLLLITSKYEGLPLAALEAMSYGIPIISFEVGGLGTLIVDGQNGRLVSQRTKEQMVKALNDWLELNTYVRSDMGYQARKTVEDFFSPSAVLPQILDIYQLRRGS